MKILQKDKDKGNGKHRDIEEGKTSRTLYQPHNNMHYYKMQPFHHPFVNRNSRDVDQAAEKPTGYTHS